MRVRNNIFKRVLSSILALTMIVAIAPIDLTVLAASGGSGNAGSSSGGAGKYWLQDGYDIIKISVSKIDDDSSIKNMASLNYRYGSNTLRGYPIYMQTGGNCEHSTAYSCAGFSNNIDYLKAEAKNQKDKNKYVRSMQYEMLDGSTVVKYSPGGGKSSTIYLEDCLSQVVSELESGALTQFDAIAFWYFYTRMALGVARDKVNLGGTSTGNSDLGDAMNDVITNGYKNQNHGYQGDQLKHEKMLQHGYVVALACIYGHASVPVKSITGSEFKKVSNYSDLDISWKDDLTSIVIDRMEGLCIDYKIKENGVNKTTSGYVAFTVQDFLALYQKVETLLDNDNTAKEYMTSTVKHRNLTSGNSGSLGWVAGKSKDRGDNMGLVRMVDYIYPVRTNGNQIKEHAKRLNNDDSYTEGDYRVFGGWGYYPFKAEPEEEKYKQISVAAPDKTQIATEITYNAYLSDSDKFDAGNTSTSNSLAERESMGANSHVMTDTVYMSDVFDVVKIFKTNEIDFNKNTTYLPTIVNKSIKLSAPTKNTTYNLARLQYQITSANGEYSSTGMGTDKSSTRTLMPKNAPYTANDTQLRNGSITVKGSDILYALGRGNEVSSDYAEHWVNGLWHPAEFRLRKRINKTNDGLKEGYYNVAKGKTYYTAKKSSDGSAQIVSHTATKDDQKVYYQIAYYSNGKFYLYPNNTNNNNVKNSGYKGGKTTDDALYTTANSTDWAKDNGHWGTFNAVDTSIYSENVGYVLINGKWEPFVFEKNGSTVKCYYCPVVRCTNLLVQIKADYLATFAEKLSNGNDNPNYKNTFQSAPIKSYLLAQNHNTDNFVKNGKTLYSMLDLYCNNTWGTLVSRNFSIQNNSGSIVKLPDNSSENSVERYETGKGAYKDWLAHKTSDNTWVTASMNNLLDSDLLKLSYVSAIDKTRPIYAETTAGCSTYVNTQLATKMRIYNASNVKQGSDKTVYKTSNLLWTKQNAASTSDENRFDSILWAANDEIAPAEGVMYMGGKANYANLTSNASDTGIIYTSNISADVPRYFGLENRYIENYFTKMLVHYNAIVYQSKAGTSAAPVLASWVGSSKAGFTSSYLPNSSKMISTGNTPVNKGFVRFGEVGIKSINGTSNIEYNKYHYKSLVNNRGTNGVSIENIESNTNVSKSVLGSGFDGRDYTFAEPVTQSGYDVPLKLDLNVYSTIDKGKASYDTTYTYDSSNKVITQTYQYKNTTTGIASGDLQRDSNNNVYLGLYPEVVMWSENDRSNGASLAYTSSIAVGEEKRYIPAMTYTKAEFNEGSVTARVTGTAVAFDTRAKALATRLGSASANTQVLYSGSALKMAFKADTAGKLTTYSLKFNGRVSNAITNDWGNSAYSASLAATAAMSKLAGNLEGSINKKLGIYNGSALKVINMDSSSSAKALTVSSPTYTSNYYNLIIRNGQVTEVQQRKSLSGGNYSEQGTYTITHNRTNAAGNLSYENTQGITRITLTHNNTSFYLNFNSNGALANNAHLSYPLNDTTKDKINKILKVYEILSGMRLLTVDERETAKSKRSVLNACFNNGVESAGVTTNTAEKLPDNNAFQTWINGHNATYNNRYTKSGNSYFEDTSVLQVIEYTADISIKDNSTATEQLPLTLGPETPSDKNKYFSNGYKGFVMASLEIKGKSTAPASIKDKVVAKASTKHTDKNNSSTKYDLTSGTQAQKNSWASNAIPDFIIADVTINEATTY